MNATTITVNAQTINIDNTKAFGETIDLTHQDIANITASVLTPTSLGVPAECGSVLTECGEFVHWNVAK